MTVRDVQRRIEGSMAPEVYLTEEKLAERYHLGRRTLQRWRQSGDGPAWCRLGHRRVVYRLSDCERWAAARTFVSRAAELAHSTAERDRGAQ